MTGDEGRNQGPKKIRLGRLYIDPVFLLLVLFSLFSVLFLALFVWLAG